MKLSKLNPASTFIMVLVIMPLLSLGILSFTNSDKTDTQLNDLRWLEGTWKNVDIDDMYITWEYKDNMLIGRSYKRKKEKEKVHKNMTIKLVADKLVYTEQLTSKKYGELKNYEQLKALDDMVVFKELGAQFETEVSYEKTGNKAYKYQWKMVYQDIQATSTGNYTRLTN